MHKQLTMPALHAGKDVFVEWPLGASLAEAEEMANLAKEKGVKTYIGLQARMQSVMVKVSNLDPLFRLHFLFLHYKLLAAGGLACGVWLISQY